MISSSKLSAFIFLVYIITFFTVQVDAQFGIAKTRTLTKDQPIETEWDGKGHLSEQDAADIATLIEVAGEDPEISQIVARLKDEKSSELESLKDTPEEQIVGTLKALMDELKMLEVLFKDGPKAVKLMHEEGMVDEQHLEQYMMNPELLEGDTRRSLVFQFVSFAVAGGYM
mmetsp:Transcript_7037/g.10086  ORF Transcript_7037/g.10086 Transcript_7037/m.10086 type:complete len:171 (+) Transcript_7037:107-619(+)|eukprot:CAMPEP_0184864276 /NCGR_PEP_ID=MMETSP0580-20130426/14383_1 /TAXON_ID=1118495 /ORGANISM="Dactyliosolen fragilissimus" /LENGTH=170 /DNA_ID=CAMNT_0027362987 /DNA_START=46 /DNA_END=558 /DNA_ORIENTATION=+